MIELLRSGAGGRRALNGVFGMAEKWGKGCSFVEQDKASAVQCRRSSVFSKLLTAFPPLESILVGQLYSTAKIASERVVPRPDFEHFRHARRHVLAMLGPVIAVGLLVALGSVFGLRISLTDSAAPAGIYRLASGIPAYRGELVGACLPASIAQEGLARGYPQQGDRPSVAEPVSKLARV